MVDAGQPLAPQIGPPTLYGDDREHGQNTEDDHSHGIKRERLVERNCRPAQPAQHLNLPPVAAAEAARRRLPPFWNPTSSGRGCAAIGSPPPTATAPPAP